MSNKSRDYSFTVNNYSDLEYTAIKSIDCRYLVVAEEVGEEGTPHLQGYIYFDNPISFSSIKKKIPRAHLEETVGTPQQNRTYVVGPYAKNGKVKPFNPLHIEKGNIPEQGKRNDISQIREQITAGLGMRQIVETATSYQSIKTAEVLLKYKEKKRDWVPNVIYIWGKSGSGKTRWAYDNFPVDDIHHQYGSKLKWFEAYDAHPVCLIDEVDSQTCYSTLKALTDRYPLRVETKGGSRSFLPKVVVLTSLVHPEILWYDYPENGYEMIRRISRIIHLPE